jgi:putative DNA primase/helicase
MTVSLKAVAAALGGVVEGGKVRFPAPGHSAKDRSATLWLNGTDVDGFRVDCFTEDWRVVRDYVRGRLGLSEWRPGEQRRAKVEPQPARASDDALARYKLERAEAIWRESRPPKGTPVETYIETARGISLPDDVVAADTIRFNPQCPFKLENGTMVTLPAMVAAMRCIHTDKFTGVHRTALRADGSGKADVPGLGDPKRMLGIAKGSAIKLSPDETVEFGLGICEGIEDGLAIIGAEWRPIWACGSAGDIRDFPVLSGIEALTIFADHDANATGQKAAHACAVRWCGAGREVAIWTPTALAGGKADWNDALRRIVDGNS